jgi:hypothetical protein
MYCGNDVNTHSVLITISVAEFIEQVHSLGYSRVGRIRERHPPAPG